MPYETISKPAAADMKVQPNLHDYETQGASFRWEDLARELDGLPAGGLNIAYEAVDRHLKTARRTRPAILWEGKGGEQETYTFEDISRLSNKWANVLRGLGVKKGDRVFVFLDRIPELYAAVFGTLFSAFGPDAVKDRLADSGAGVLLTSPELWRRISQIRADLPDLRHVIHVVHGGGGGTHRG